MPSDATIEITCDGEIARANLETDGNIAAELRAGDRVTIRRAEHPVRFARVRDGAFFKRLEDKLQWGVPIKSTMTATSLLRLTIENVGLIARAELDFANGLTVVTGETGSGKTMLLGALGLALGERADSESVRGGAERARVALEIAPDDALRARLAEAGFALAADDDLIVQREVLASGRSQGRINGLPASASQLRELVGALVDVVSQHEAQRLLAPAYALDLVDRFGGGDDARAARRGAASCTTSCARRASGWPGCATTAELARAEFARFALAEIDAAAVADDDEDERLRARRDVLANAERILAALGRPARRSRTKAARSTRWARPRPRCWAWRATASAFAELGGAAAALQSEANELAARIARERDAIELDPAELDAVTERLDALDRLKKKYGGTLAAVRARREAFAGEIAEVDDRDARLAAAERELAATEAALRERAAALGARRRRAPRTRSSARCGPSWPRWRCPPRGCASRSSRWPSRPRAAWSEPSCASPPTPASPSARWPGWPRAASCRGCCWR